jgi:O-methyltransferase
MIKKIVKKLLPNFIINALRTPAKLETRISALEEGRQNRRHAAVHDLTDYLINAQIPGDYCEFGVYRGDTFIQAHRSLSGRFHNMRFLAFDSFAGLPNPKNHDARDGYTGNFHESEFTCSKEDFMTNLQAKRVELERIKIIKGWFNKTLAPGKAEEYGIEKIAAAWIDCDLYESTVPVLNFILPHLSIGSVIVFDDWRCFRNLPDLGEQRACREWLVVNPDLTLHELFSFGFHGVAFTVGSR